MNKNTQGGKKIKNYFSALLESDSFNKLVTDCRKKYKIPKKGLKKGKTCGLICRPKNFDNFEKLLTDIDNYCRDKGILNLDFSTHIYNKIVYNMEFLTMPSGDICIISDLGSPKKIAIVDPVMAIEMEEHINTMYPIAIQVSPYASSRDIIDFVKKNSKIIQGAQKKYKTDKIKIGKYRTKKEANLARDKIIYDNRKKTRKELYKLINKQFGDSPDEGALGKIISIENKRRKEL